MALAIGVREGESVFVGDTKVTFSEVTTPSRFKILVDGAMPVIYELQKDIGLEILPNVKLQICDHMSTDQYKFRFSAPRHIAIVRENAKQKT